MSDGTPTKIRIWHASRDAYHCAFRLIRLLDAAPNRTMELERLRILDMYLLFPTLLHRMSMTQELKARFRSLQVPKSGEIFSHLPSAASAYQELRVYQNAAASYLAAKDVLRKEALKKGIAELQKKELPAGRDRHRRSHPKRRTSRPRGLFGHRFRSAPIGGKRKHIPPCGASSEASGIMIPLLTLRHLGVFRRGKVMFSQPFHTGVNIIHGDNGSGKSTIADFIFFALGGDLKEWKPQAAARQTG